MKLFLFLSLFLSSLVGYSEPLNCINSRRIIYVAYMQHYAQPEIDKKVLDKVIDAFIKKEDPLKILLSEKDVKEIKNDFKKRSKEYTSQFLSQFEYSTYSQSYFFNAEAYNQTGCDFIQLSLKKLDKALNKYISQFEIVSKKSQEDIYKIENNKKNKLFKEYSNRAKSEKELIKRMNTLLEYRIASTGYDKVSRNFYKKMDRTSSRKYSNLINSFLSIQDAHSSYIDQMYLDDKENENMSSALNPIKSGYGVMFFKKDEKSVYPKVVKVLKNSVLEKTNQVFKDDLIINIDGHDLKDLTIKEISELLSYSNKATIVFRTFIDKTSFPDVYEDVTLSLNKGTYDSEFIHSEIMKKNDKTFLYIKLDAFYHSHQTDTGSAYDLREIYLDAVNNKKLTLDGVILDLRDNYGGHVGEATRLAHLFLGSKVILRYIDNKFTEFVDYSQPLINGSFLNPLITEPLILLTNRNSASASEILAGTIKDYKRGLIIGDDSTFGKGSMQMIYPYFESLKLGELRITTNLFYLASGITPQNKGIPSDVVLPSPTSFEKNGEKFMENALNPKKPLENLITDDFNLVDSELVNQLQYNANKRINSNSDFNSFKTEKSIEKYVSDLNKNEDIIFENNNDPVLKESLSIFEEYSYLVKKRNKALNKREYPYSDHLGQ